MSQIDEWQAFVKVVEAKSFSRAAERLGVAKSAVSRRISDLEARLGTQLLTRTTRRLGITLAGRDFYENCVRMLAEIDEVEASVRSDARAVSGRLKIAIPNAFGTRHLAPVLAAFAVRHPAVEFDLDASDRMVDLVAEGFDMAVRVGKLSDSSLIVRRLAPSRFTVTASPAYWLRHGTPRHPDDLAAHMHIRDTLSSLPGRLEWRHREHKTGHVEPSHKIAVSSGEFALQLAAADLGFVVGPSFLSHGMISSGQLLPVLTDYAWSASAIHVVYPPTRHRAAKIRAIVEHLVEAFASDPPWDREIAKAVGATLAT
jgi:DNA-binding transcriptional LysR family regulator